MGRREDQGRRQAPPRLRHLCWPAWKQALRWSEAAYCYRQSRYPSATDSAFGRGHQRSRRRIPASCAGGPLRSHAKPHVHRHTTVERCTRLAVIEDGVIVEEGTFSELSAGNGYFANLANGMKKAEQKEKKRMSLLATEK